MERDAHRERSEGQVALSEQGGGAPSRSDASSRNGKRHEFGQKFGWKRGTVERTVAEKESPKRGVSTAGQSLNQEIGHSFKFSAKEVVFSKHG